MAVKVVASAKAILLVTFAREAAATGTTAFPVRARRRAKPYPSGLMTAAEQ